MWQKKKGTSDKEPRLVLGFSISGFTVLGSTTLKLSTFRDFRL